MKFWRFIKSTFYLGSIFLGFLNVWSAQGGGVAMYKTQAQESEQSGDLPGAIAAYQALSLYATNDSDLRFAQRKIGEIRETMGYRSQEYCGVKVYARGRTGAQKSPTGFVSPSRMEMVQAALSKVQAALTNKEKYTFKSYYKGTEPFLQNNKSDMARKILLNIQGIELAETADYVGARQAFEEALAIDSSFGPARENLSILDKIGK